MCDQEKSERTKRERNAWKFMEWSRAKQQTTMWEEGGREKGVEKNWVDS